MAVDRQGQLWIWGKADARLGLGSLGSSNSDLGIEVEQSNSIKLPMLHTVLKTKGCKIFQMRRSGTRMEHCSYRHSNFY